MLPTRRQRRPRARLRRLPERRHRQGHRARRARGLRVDRARQALHHHRHGDRPGQDLEHERARPRRRARWTGRSPAVGTTTFRPPYTPVTFGALAGPHARRAVRPGPHDADPRLGRRRTARCSRMSACGSAPATSREPARTCTPPWRANARPCATSVGIFDASTLGKIEVVGPGRGRVPEPHLHQRLARSSSRAAAATA